MSGLQDTCRMCGGLIVATAPWAIADAVARHNATDDHRRARRRRQLVEANRDYRARIRADVADRRLALAVLRESAA